MGSHRETRRFLVRIAETDHLLLWLHNALNHAESRWSSYSPDMSTAATTVTAAEIATQIDFIQPVFFLPSPYSTTLLIT